MLVNLENILRPTELGEWRRQ